VLLFAHLSFIPDCMLAPVLPHLAQAGLRLQQHLAFCTAASANCVDCLLRLFARQEVGGWLAVRLTNSLLLICT
jgi:hypothetical protein